MSVCLHHIGFLLLRPRKGTDPLFEQKGWCQFPGRFEQDFLRKPRKVLL